MQIITVFAIIAISYTNAHSLVAYNTPVPTIASGFANVISSSEWDSNHGVSHIRLDYAVRPGVGASSWSAGTNDAYQYVIVNFGFKPVRVVKVVTQGRGDYPQWVKTYK